MRAPIRMPPGPMLSSGPLRTFVGTLHGYYRQAGRPSLRVIHTWIEGHAEGGGTISKESIRRMLAGISVPLRWDSAESTFLALCALAGRDPDERYVDKLGRHTNRTLRDDFHRRWRAAVTASYGRDRVEADNPRVSDVVG